MPRLEKSIQRLVHHIIAIGWGTGIVKLFRVQFARDGSIYVHFPYHPDVPGIVARCSVPVGEGPTLDMKPGGAVTSHKVKYSHHVDGRCHFSQDGKVRTEITTRGSPLADDVGHLFSVDAHGLEHFRAMNSDEYYDDDRIGLADFHRGTAPDGVHVAVRWKKLDVQTIDDLTNPVRVQGPDGTVVNAFGMAPPSDSPMADHLLLATFAGRTRLSEDEAFSLLFTGGFGEALDDPTKRSSLLILAYPTRNVDGLRSIDLSQVLG